MTCDECGKDFEPYAYVTSDGREGTLCCYCGWFMEESD